MANFIVYYNDIKNGELKQIRLSKNGININEIYTLRSEKLASNFIAKKQAQFNKSLFLKPITDEKIGSWLPTQTF